MAPPILPAPTRRSGEAASSEDDVMTPASARSAPSARTWRPYCGRSGLAVRLEEHRGKRLLRRLARPDDELECLVVALAGIDRGAEHCLKLAHAGFHAL